MEALIFLVVMLVVTLIVAGFYFLFPKISRRGLLFGVYVGEQVSGGDQARQITRSWYMAMSIWLIISLAVGIFTGSTLQPGPRAVVALFLLLIGFVFEYLRAYRHAQKLAPSTPPIPEAAQISLEESRPLFLPIAAMGLGLLGGLLAIGFSWGHYAQLPERVPMHFGLSGQPDGWSSRSFVSVMLLPIMSLILGVGLGGMAYLVSHAKLAVRHNDSGLLLEAQQRFRRIMANYLSIVALLTSAMMTLLSISSIQVALKELPALPVAFMALCVLLMIVALGGGIYIALRYGQGGSRLEQGAADAPLTDGLADNRRWVLGMFYVNPEDPSVFVEKRFGFGYTLNFGNRKAVFLMTVFLGLIILITTLALLKK
jgi:uncharacterized membrane protein